jgi:DNA-3-methyladenine glycosylase II
LIVTEKLRLKAVPPFDFELSARIFSGGDARIRKYENGRFWQVIRVDGKLILTVIESSGTVDKPELLAELRSDEKILENDKTKAEQLIRKLFNLDFDLEPFYREARKDKIMANVIQRQRGLKSPTTATVFEALIDSVIEQQISLRVASSLENRLIVAFADTLCLGEKDYYAYPTPRKLASASAKRLRGCGPSLKKAQYIRDISKLITDDKLDLEKFKAYHQARRIVAELDGIMGIGVWTAELTMVRGMQRLDTMPADDMGLRRVISHYYCNDEKISPNQAREIAEKWRKWKGLAAYYLIVADIADTAPSQVINSVKSDSGTSPRAEK